MISTTTASPVTAAALRRLRILPLFSLLLIIINNPASAIKRSYVVYMGGHSHGRKLGGGGGISNSMDLDHDDIVADSHHEFLKPFLGRYEYAEEAIFYSYTRYINGFAAMLEDHVAAQLSNDPKVVSVFLNKGRKLQTTRSWEFMGLENYGGFIPSHSIWNKARFGEDTIIANLDTGVWPESKSFSDDELGPIPSRWRGICQNQSDPAFHCNRKLIGARYFNKGYQSVAGPLNSSFHSPRDNEGHGSHTLSTAGGNFVAGASVFGFGQGTVKGGSPRARVAAYKVCWPPIAGDECFDADILAGFDAAIHDGVDVLSVSLGGDPNPFFNDSVAIGSFHAVKHGIPVICSAGNSGPTSGSVSNTAPWEITVGASTMDRKFPSIVVLGNKNRFEGESLSPKALPSSEFYPLVNAAEVKLINASAHEAQLCKAGTLDPRKVKGKILVCLRGDNARVDKGEQAMLVGAVGMILANAEVSGNEILADPHVLPASHINFTNGVSVFAYINSTKYPKAYITRAITQIGIKPAPFMAAFSSVGPNSVTPEILKPDVTAPGVSVIAAYTEAQGPTNQKYDDRRVPFNAISGTSMACPHVSGIVGLLKTLYPHWSPAAVKSAIMTSAHTKDNNLEPLLNASYKRATPFNYGSGHLDPNGAADPGLVYDIDVNEYLSFLCALGYSETQILQFSDGPFNCSNPIAPTDLNYPSITVPKLLTSITVTRRLKNVGSPGTYKVHIENPAGVSVNVKPKRLTFTKIDEEQIFKITIKVKKQNEVRNYVYGDLTWSDGTHHVRSPIVVKAIQ